MLTRSYSYAELRDDAVAVAYRLIGQGVRTADRIALIAETGPDFAAPFFGANYAGASPVPLPLPTRFSSEERRVGKECLRTCRSWGSPCHSKTNNKIKISH